LKKPTVILSAVGIAILTGITAWLGVDHVLGAMRRIGIGGFAILLAGQVILDLGLGLSWFVACPDLGLIRTIVSRAVRDAASNILPFSQLGGMAMGVRATCARPIFLAHHLLAGRGSARRVEWPEAVAANLVDITAEVLGQIAFVLLALLCLIHRQGGNRFTWPILGGMTLLTVGIAGFIYTQKRGGKAIKGVADLLGRHIAADWRGTLIDNMDAFQNHLDALWKAPARIASSAALHLVFWVGSAILTWIAFDLLGAHPTITDAIAIEGVVCGIMSAGFLVPASLGVQEAAYVTLGMAFGIDGQTTLGLSLLRRGRDITLGIPILIMWQISEMRRIQQASAAHISEEDLASTQERRVS